MGFLPTPYPGTPGKTVRRGDTQLSWRNPVVRPAGASHSGSYLGTEVPYQILDSSICPRTPLASLPPQLSARGGGAGFPPPPPPRALGVENPPRRLPEALATHDPGLSPVPGLEQPSPPCEGQCPLRTFSPGLGQAWCSSFRAWKWDSFLLHLLLNCFIL